MNNENKQSSWSESDDNNNFTYTLNKRKSKKQFILAITSSVFIGVIFGIIILNMIKQEEQHHALLSNTGNGDIGSEEDSDNEKNTNNDHVDSTKLDSINVFVVQGGVFSEEENAKEWEEKFNNIQFPAMRWYRDQNYFLLTGISSTKEHSNTLAEKMKNKGLDVFVKEWSVPSTQVNFNEKDTKWLQSYLELCEKSLQSIDKQEGIIEHEWKNLMNEADKESEQINALSDVIQQVIFTNKLNNNLEEQQVLLQLLSYYEEIIVE